MPSAKHPWDLMDLNYLTDFILIEMTIFILIDFYAHGNDGILDILY